MKKKVDRGQTEKEKPRAPLLSSRPIAGNPSAAPLESTRVRPDDGVDVLPAHVLRKEIYLAKREVDVVKYNLYRAMRVKGTDVKAYENGSRRRGPNPRRGQVHLTPREKTNLPQDPGLREVWLRMEAMRSQLPGLKQTASNPNLNPNHVT